MTKIQLKVEPFHKHATTIVYKLDTGTEVTVKSEVDYKQVFPQSAALARCNFLQPTEGNRFKLWEPAC